MPKKIIDDRISSKSRL